MAAEHEWSERTFLQNKATNWGARYFYEAWATILRSPRFGQDPPSPTIMQGGFNKGGVAASGGSHDGGDVYDTTAYNYLNRLKVWAMLGGYGWFRPYNWDGDGGGQHLHLGIRGGPTRAYLLKVQETNYDDRRDGLRSNRYDGSFRLPGNAKPLFVFPEDPRGRPGVYYLTRSAPGMEWPSPASKTLTTLAKGSKFSVIAVVRVGSLYYAINSDGVCLELGGVGIDRTTLLGKTSTPLPPTPPPMVKRIDRTDWKITLPDGTEVTQPAFATLQRSPWFWEKTEDGSWHHRAPCGGGATTPNSKYLRSECREMKNKGRDKAGWSSTLGEHRMDVELAFTHLPDVKRHAVGAQIHDAVDDVCMVRLEGKKLFVESPYTDDLLLDANYPLGARFFITIHVKGGTVTVTYRRGNVKVVRKFSRKGSGWYYKAGCYTQSNTAKGDKASAYGEVVIYALTVKHT